jgi:hypothetical protein
MGKHQYVLFIFLSILLFPNTGESAGVFGGAEVDNKGQRFFYMGAQTEGKYFFQIFAGDLLYDFEDAGKTTEAKLRFITPAIGVRKQGPMTLSLAVGPTFREKKEEQSTGVKKETGTGGFLQLGGFIWQEDKNFEFLASYTTLDNFIWSRMRGKKRVTDRFFTGAELFWMGNEDFDSWGGGPLLELSGKRGGLTLKVGYKHTSIYQGGMYTGIEFYVPF